VRYPPNGPRIEYYDHHSQWSWIGHLLGFLAVVALVALIVVLVLRLLNRSGLGVGSAAVVAPVTTAMPAASRPDDPALAALRLRYAQGDVGRDDYLRMASALGALVSSSEGDASTSA
jgi:uncharacterized membrane protein